VLETFELRRPGSRVTRVSGVAGVSDKLESKRFRGSRVTKVSGMLETFELGRSTGSRVTE
jgi:hypothetical protein